MLIGYQLFIARQRRSRKGAWIEIPTKGTVKQRIDGRSRKGAWIEIYLPVICFLPDYVAPARERGLKYLNSCNEI